MVKNKKQFEDSYEKLVDIIKLIEKNEVSIDESLNLYKEAIELISNCDDILKKAKLEVESYKENSGEISG